MIWNVDRTRVGLSSDRGGLSLGGTLPGSDLSTRILELAESSKLIIVRAFSKVKGGHQPRLVETKQQQLEEEIK